MAGVERIAQARQMDEVSSRLPWRSFAEFFISRISDPRLRNRSFLIYYDDDRQRSNSTRRHEPGAVDVCLEGATRRLKEDVRTRDRTSGRIERLRAQAQRVTRNDSWCSRRHRDARDGRLRWLLEEEGNGEESGPARSKRRVRASR